MAGNKIVSYRNPNDLNELPNKSYVDSNLSKYLPCDRSLSNDWGIKLRFTPSDGFTRTKI